MRRQDFLMLFRGFGEEESFVGSGITLGGGVRVIICTLRSLDDTVMNFLRAI